MCQTVKQQFCPNNVFSLKTDSRYITVRPISRPKYFSNTSAGKYVCKVLCTQICISLIMIEEEEALWNVLCNCEFECFEMTCSIEAKVSNSETMHEIALRCISTD